MNTSTNGGGTRAGLLLNCLIERNRAFNQGGGSHSSTQQFCTVAGNRAVEGGGVYNALVRNSLVWDNRLLTGFPDNYNPGSVFSNACSFPLPPGSGNLAADPLFVARGAWPVAGDYHLQSEGWFWDMLGGTWVWADATSPCIDAGDPAAPLGDEAPCAPGDALSERADVNTRVNLGAYGGTSEASLAP